ncbi:type II secretion system protein [Paraferrimonas haliotis]|uniref:MSHA pilin protein MshA n=1 Tax=Paraferrimonas haliotis TaxID=2013866 RepID=A0AA37TKP6_9GAMM|nr:prepilin-type N-terminal cleavage/methylation domain-containing protein [Paraferrimonas haliotis]GLS82348.1 MSHA pilin protein MshA [Paraferrimonas haliotis]
MKQAKGFTLIELVVVIIILGILAVTAAPKFINLQTDARISTLNGLKGAIQGANGLVFAKAAIGGDEQKASTDWGTGEGVDIGTGTNAATAFGYLQADEDELTNAVDADFSDEWTVSAPAAATPPASIILTQVGSPDDGTTTTTADMCRLIYSEAANTQTLPVYELETDGC